MNITPTKSNLLKVKNSLKFAQKSYELLDKKRNILIRELMSYVNKARNLQETVNKTFGEAYEALERANIAIGISRVEDIALTIPEADNFSILHHSIMGVEIPKVIFEREDIKTRYSFYSSDISMDIAYKKFNEVKYILFNMAEIENTIFKLAMEIKKTQKRANALKNIQIPKFLLAIKNISDILEEKEREEFFRLKVLKNK